MVPRKGGKPTDRFPELDKPWVRVVELSLFIIACIVLVAGWLTL